MTKLKTPNPSLRSSSEISSTYLSILVDRHLPQIKLLFIKIGVNGLYGISGSSGELT